MKFLILLLFVSCGVVTDDQITKAKMLCDSLMVERIDAALTNEWTFTKCSDGSFREGATFPTAQK
jgi:hypothetical protein